MTWSKEDMPIKYKNRIFYPWRKTEESYYKLEKKNGDKKVGLFGFTTVMRTKNSFKPMQKVGK